MKGYNMIEYQWISYNTVSWPKYPISQNIQDDTRDIPDLRIFGVIDSWHEWKQHSVSLTSVWGCCSSGFTSVSYLPSKGWQSAFIAHSFFEKDIYASKKTRSSAKQAGSSLPMPEDPYRTCWGPGRRSCRAGHAICWNIQQVGNLLALQTLAYRIASLPLYFSSSALKGQDQHECKLVLKLLKTSSIINLTTCD